MAASALGNTAICEVLLENNANIELVNSDGLSALMYAATYGHLEICKLLIEHGAPIDQHDNRMEYYFIHILKARIFNKVIEFSIDFYSTSLLHASNMGHTEVFQFLLEKGAPVDTPNQFDQ